MQETKEKAISEKKKWISITGLCNNNCIFCLDGDKSNKQNKSEKEVKGEIDSGIKEGATRLVLSGGDPTIHPNLIEFIKYGKKKGYKKVQIITNGRMLAYKSFVNALAEARLDEVTFSIHGHTAELHDKLTGSPGSFSQIVQGIKNALAKGFIVNTDTVITKANYKYLPEIIEFVHKLGVNEVNLMSIVAFGNAWKNKDEVLYDFEDIVPYVDKVIKFCEENNMFLWFSRFPAEFLEGHEEYIDSYKKVLEEVLSRGEDLFEKTPFCKGERCKYCGLITVCDALIKKEYDNSEPLCLTDSGKKEINNIIKVEKEFKKAAEEICLNRKIKRLKCKTCIYNDSCPGILSEKVRKGGFSLFEPIIRYHGK